MRVIGWILTIIGCLWAFSGITRIIAGTIGAMPGGNGAHVGAGLITVALAWLLIWCGGKLRAKAAKVSA